MLKVLYLEDEPLLGKIVKESLESRQCALDWYLDGEAASEAIERAGDYDIAVLDVQMPGEDGFSIGKRIRAAFPNLPILYLTARVQAKDALAGFEAGGNDYVRKPFSMEELLVRMHNLVEVSQGGGLAASATGTAPAATPNSEPPAANYPTGEIYEFGDFRFEYNNLRLTFRPGEPDENIHSLSHREAELLRMIVRARGQEKIERKTILLEIWHDDGFFNSRNLDVYMRKLRAMLEADPRVRILTLRGVGYRFVVEQ